MSSVINEANSNIATGNQFESRIKEANSIAQLEAQKEQANATADIAKNRQTVYQNIAQYNQSGAEQERAQGQQMINSGNAKQAVGGGLMAIGGVLVAMGLATSIFGGAGAALVAKGFGMIGQGVGQIVAGGVERGNGQTLLLIAQEKLDKAVENEILSKQEAKIVKKELNRSQIMEMKIRAFQDMVDVIRPQLEKLGLNPEELDEKKLQKMFDKLLEDGADTLAKGGILETDLTGPDGEPLLQGADGQPLTGTFFFTRDENTGDFFQIDVAKDEDGNILTGALGEPLLDTENAKRVADGPLKDFLEMQFQFVDLAAQFARQLGTTDYNDYGEGNFAGYDINNLDHMREFSDLVKKTNISAIEDGQLEGPLKTINENGTIYLQKWDWINDIPIGVKVPIDEIAGGGEHFDRGDIDSYIAAKDRSERALEELGFSGGPGGGLTNLLISEGDFEYDPNRLGSVDFGSFSSISGRNSDAFRDFANVRNSISGLNEPSILEESIPDLVDNGG